MVAVYIVEDNGFYFQIGPALVYLTFNSIFGSGLFLQTLTPQEPLLQKYTLLTYADWWIPTFITKFMVSGFDVQVSQSLSLSLFSSLHPQLVMHTFY